MVKRDKRFCFLFFKDLVCIVTFACVSRQLPTRTILHQDNSPPCRCWSWWVILLVSSGPGGELSWWGVVLVVSCPRTICMTWICVFFCPLVRQLKGEAMVARSLPTAVPEGPQLREALRAPRTPRGKAQMSPRFYPVMKESRPIDNKVGCLKKKKPFPHYEVQK